MSEVQELAAIPRDAVAGRTRPRSAASVAAPWLPYVIAFVVAFGFYWFAAHHINRQLPTGDEPSYVLDAFSMARDGDRDLSNQFDPNNTAPLVKLFGVPALPHGQVWVKGHGFISWHGAGLGVVLVPAVWFGDA